MRTDETGAAVCEGQGKPRYSPMTSCAEMMFCLRNWPAVKPDGDDGRFIGVVRWTPPECPDSPRTPDNDLAKLTRGLLGAKYTIELG